MDNIKNLLSLSGKTSLITGATGVIGEGLCVTLAEMGSDLILTDTSEDKLHALREKLSSYNIETCLLTSNLERSESRDFLINDLLARKYQIDILVNNAAFTGDSTLTGWLGELKDQSVETWTRALEVNLTSVFHLTKGLEPLFSKNIERPTSIINLASIYGFKTPVWELYEDIEKMGNPAAYSVSKAGLIHLTKWLATVLAPCVRVNSISPGGLLREQPNLFVDRYKKRVPLSRMASVNDVCGTVIYLASDLSRYVTGQNIIVDGGFTL
jgi:NAD(P)-dependent dehydrogenase (short-subunit alcohol dehydrogenase family)